MEYLRRLGLLDEHGQPVDDRLYGIFERLVGKFRRRFPRILDDVEVVKIFEKAVLKLVQHERERGPLEKPHGYAWATLRTVAISQSRGASIEGHRFAADDGVAASAVAMMPAQDGTPEQLETQILLAQLRAQLTAEEELVFAAKIGGYSSRQIAKWRGCSPQAVDVMFSRIRKKLREFIAGNGKN
jgi:RNA polymerase sigma factor (sigma-70 family)